VVTYFSEKTTKAFGKIGAGILGGKPVHAPKKAGEFIATRLVNKTSLDDPLLNPCQAAAAIHAGP
jgi:hypothetical protein